MNLANKLLPSQWLGAHDVGGDLTTHHQIIDRTNHEYQQWEINVHAMLSLLERKHLMNDDQLRKGIELMQPDAYQTATYYGRWAVSACHHLINEKILPKQILDHNLGVVPKSEKVMLNIGEVVCVRAENTKVRWRKPHIRTPGYIFGCQGIVTRLVGTFNDPMLGGFGQSVTQPLYRVRFQQKVVWPEYVGDDTDTIELDIYQAWLEPIRDNSFSSLSTPLPPPSYYDVEPMLWSGSWIKIHPTRTSIETKAKNDEPLPTLFQPLSVALVQSCLDIGIFTIKELVTCTEVLSNTFGEQAAGKGREIVAKAWMDSNFKEKLLKDAKSALRSVDLEGYYQFVSPTVIDQSCKSSTTVSTTSTTTLLVVEQTDQIHNLIVCTLCSCWPSKLLGNPPAWYKSSTYRARAVREPRSVLNEFGVVLKQGMEVRVHDSTADLRYLVLPARPKNTEGFTLNQLAALVTRDSMIGCGVIDSPTISTSSTASTASTSSTDLHSLPLHSLPLPTLIPPTTTALHSVPLLTPPTASMPSTTDINISHCLYAIASANSITEARHNLDQALHPHKLRALKHQALQEQNANKLLQNGEILPTLIKNKLSTPHHINLTPEESCECLSTMTMYGEQRARQAQGKSLVVVLGNTGSGKSCFVNLLQGCTFEVSKKDDYRMVIRKDSIIKEICKIGHTNQSTTFAPQLSKAKESIGLNGFAFADCPGFLDNRGFEINIANAVNIKNTISSADTARVVVIINYHSLMADRGKGIADLFDILISIFGTVENAMAHATSVLLAISQAPVKHPETGSSMTLEQHRARLLDPSGLNQASANLLLALNQNVICFHLLGDQRNDIDGSWSNRREIADRIKALVPHSQQSSLSNGGLFYSVVSDADKESLRQLINQIGNKIEAAVMETSLNVAVDLIHKLLQVKTMIQDVFITTVVDATLHNVIVGQQESILEGVQKIDANFNKARIHLKESVAALIAVCGIDHTFVEDLISLVFKGNRELEEAIQETEDIRGKKEAALGIREVVREAGDNVVLEVMLLPKGEKEMQHQHHEEEQQLIKLIQQLTKTDNKIDIVALELYSTELRKLSYRAQAANKVWKTHIELAIRRMEQYDRLLVSSEENGAIHFWNKIESSAEFLLCNLDDGKIPVDWNRKEINAQDCEVMSAEFRRLKGPPALKRLFLSGNQIGNIGLTAIIHATAFGALPKLERLHVQNNSISDIGFANVARQIGNGYLHCLTLLDFGRNAISDHGMKIFADVLLENGANVLQNLTTLYLSSNNIGSIGASCFAEAIRSDFNILSKLKILWLNRNVIADVGVLAVHDAISAGALVSLCQLMFQGNLAQPALQQMSLAMVRKKKEKKEEQKLQTANQYDSMRGL